MKTTYMNTTRSDTYTKQHENYRIIRIRYKSYTNTTQNYHVFIMYIFISYCCIVSKIINPNCEHDRSQRGILLPEVEGLKYTRKAPLYFQSQKIHF